MDLQLPVGWVGMQCRYIWSATAVFGQNICKRRSKHNICNGLLINLYFRKWKVVISKSCGFSLKNQVPVKDIFFYLNEAYKVSYVTFQQLTRSFWCCLFIG